MTDMKTLETLEKNGQIALRYASKDNFNGSINAVAGICDTSGLVFGLMPHPERFTRWTQHPWWTRLCAHTRSGDTLGLSIFKQAVVFVCDGEQAQIDSTTRASAHHNTI